VVVSHMESGLPAGTGSKSCRWVLMPVLSMIVGIRLCLRCPSARSIPDVSIELDTHGWEATARNNLAHHGYLHARQLVQRTEVEDLRKIAHNFCYGEERRALPLSWGGYSVPAFLDLPEFEEARWLLNDPRVHRLLSAIFNGSEYRFASHNDVGCDFVGVWHKDVLRGPQKKFQVHDVWTPDQSGEQHEIYKLLLYLQDHEHDSRAMKVIPGSHLKRNISLESGYVAVHPRMGDLVVIDQRISHSGNTYYDPFGPGRLFLQVGFGKANLFTEEFARGTHDRQQGYQAKMNSTRQQRGLSTVLTDAKFFFLGLVFTAIPPQVLNFLADIDVKKYALLGRVIFGSNSGAQK